MHSVGKIQSSSTITQVIILKGHVFIYFILFTIATLRKDYIYTRLTPEFKLTLDMVA
jgi:hypothetical protein